MTNITIDDLGFRDEEERVSYLHRIGNLTLLFNLENTSLGESQFKDKIATYQNSDFVITRSIVTQNQTTIATGIQRDFIDMLNRNFKQYESQNGQWTKSLIIQRSKDIGELLVNCVQNKL